MTYDPKSKFSHRNSFQITHTLLYKNEKSNSQKNTRLKSTAPAFLRHDRPAVAAGPSREYETRPSAPRGGPATNPPPEMWTKSGSDVGRAAAVSSDSQRRLPYVPPRSSEHFHRLKFYGALEKRERRTPQEPVWTRSGSSLGSAAGGSGAPVSPLGSGRGSPGSPFQSMSPRSRSFLPWITPLLVHGCGPARVRQRMISRAPLNTAPRSRAHPPY